MNTKTKKALARLQTYAKDPVPFSKAAVARAHQLLKTYGDVDLALAEAEQRRDESGIDTRKYGIPSASYAEDMRLQWSFWTDVVVLLDMWDQ